MKNKWIVTLVGALLLGVLFSGLTGCTQPPRFIENPILANLPEQDRNLLQAIEATGIQVIKQGMRFTFVIPTDEFFENDTQEFKTHRDEDFVLLARFITRYTRYFKNPKVDITGYTDKVWSYYARQKLSMHYAEMIGTVLTEDGVDSSMLKVRGVGAKDPIASNHYPMGTAFNRRVVVEIH